MQDHRNALNNFLVNTFNDLLRIEDKALSLDEFKNLSVCEMHVIDAVSKGVEAGTNKAAEIAEGLGITPGSLTISSTILERKGYLQRKRDTKDKRVVRLYLSERGLAANHWHRHFHMEMVDAVLRRLSSQEQDALVKALEGISEYFRLRQKELTHG